MRIVGGELRNRRLSGPTWKGLRPTSDKLRETLFNILAPRVAGARVLDGYAGTGAVGIEALSRGAAHVTFVEADRRALALIQRNLTVPGVEGRYTIQRGDVGAVLRRLGPEVLFDIIFLDPPYEQPVPAAVLEEAGRHLDRGGVLVVERATRTEPVTVTGLERLRDVISGDSTLTFFRRRAGGDAPEPR